MYSLEVVAHGSRLFVCALDVQERLSSAQAKLVSAAAHREQAVARADASAADVWASSGTVTETLEEPLPTL